MQLLEREFELSRIAALAARAAAGHGTVAVIEGPAGIGKSTLIEEAAQLAGEAGVEWRWARGSELENDYPFGIVGQLFEPLLSSFAEEERERLFAGAARHARPLFATAADPREEPADEDAFVVLHGLYWMVAGLAERRPLALAVDDAHWADLPSLRLLAYLVTRAHDLPVMVVAGTRPPAPGPRATLLDELVSNPIVEVLRPGPLGARSVSRLLRDELGIEPEPEFVTACLEATGGNPFLLREAALSMAELRVAPVAAEADRAHEAAPGIARSVARRLRQLAPDALALARSIAVLGDAKDTRIAATLAGLEPGPATTAGDALVRAEVLDDDGVDFVHPIVRSAIHTDIAPGERSRMHARAARLLSSSGWSDAEVALHLLGAAPAGDAWTVEVLRRAARDANSRGAPDVAETCLQRALAEPPPEPERIEVLRELGLVQAVIRGPEGLARLRESMEAASDGRRRAEIGVELSRLMFLQGFFPQSAEIVERAMEGLGGDQRELESRLAAQLFLLALTDLGLLSKLGGLRALADRIRASDAAHEAPQLAALAWIEAVSAPPAARGADLAVEALAGLDRWPGEEGGILAGAGPALMAANRFQEAKTLFDLAALEARRRGSLAALAFCVVMRAPVEIRLGSPLTVEADAHELLELGRQLDVLGEQARVPYPWLLAPLIDALLDRGDVDAAERAFADSPVAGDELPELLQFNYLLASLGRLRLAEGRGAEAVALLRECGRRVTQWGIENPGLVPWRSSLATALASTGQHEEALTLADEEVRLARLYEVPRELGIALRVSGLIQGGDEGIGRLEEAVAVLQESPAVLERARALADLGAALRRRGNRAAAREPLRKALDLSLRAGAQGLAEQAHAELIVSGARPRRLALAGPEALTASERRVAEMAAQGLTNRQIAEALFVTEKTIEGHLHQAFAKLDIGSRTQLESALRKPPPV